MLLSIIVIIYFHTYRRQRSKYKSKSIIVLIIYDENDRTSEKNTNDDSCFGDVNSIKKCTRAQGKEDNGRNEYENRTEKTYESCIKKY